MANFAAADQVGLDRIIKRKLKKDPVPPAPDRRLPGRYWLENRTLVTPCTTSSFWLNTHTPNWSAETHQ
jgi:hypothetical protein